MRLPGHIDIAAVVRKAVSHETEIPEQQLRTDEPLERYGVESVMSVAIVRRLEQTFGELSKTLIFEFQTIDALSSYLQEEYGGRVDSEVPASAPSPAPVGSVRIVETVLGDVPAIRATQPVRASCGNIAIIGMSGRFPQARTLDEFWLNLKQGRDCITEIPARLWNWRDYWSPERGVAGTSYCKWGGFIEDADCFDPLFFNISNLAAEGMDPQERLFLEAVHHTLEDAGYTREALRGATVGLYVSAMWGDYQHYGTRDAATDSSFASIANRASYIFDFTGPSIALDTSCSGSLTTLHLACESLRNGEVDLAIAGGVNVTSHPHKYLALSRTGFASTDGRCRSFAAEANGYVPGDGVGALLLKPLAQAIADEDHIHAVINATALNHGGRSSGFTVPSASAQAQLIDTALQRAAVNPRTITYVEAHAPGTPLGDPIEVRGLTTAFRKYTDDVGFCAVGSVKSNVGHLESAAGIASIVKVVLQMQHRLLVPSIHAATLNPNIQFDRTPFYVQRELTPWPVPTIGSGATAVRHPRRAAVSAFGHGGANAHVILEEYAAPVTRRTPAAEQVIVLSSKAEDRLQVMAENLLTYIDRLITLADSTSTVQDGSPADQLLRYIGEAVGIRTEFLDGSDGLGELLVTVPVSNALVARVADEFGITLDDAAIRSMTIAELTELVCREGCERDIPAVADALLLERIAYTLQVGREPMPYRLAVVAQSLNDLRDQLTRYAAGTADPQRVWTGHVVAPANSAVSAEEAQHVARLVSDRRLERLGRFWCTGLAVPWSGLYVSPKPRRIPLPLYPFGRERCWVDRLIPPPVEVPPRERETEAAAGIATDVDVPHQLTYRPSWLPVTMPASESRQGLDTPGCHVIVYPQDAASLAAALTRHLPSAEVYRIALGTRTQLVDERSWEVDVYDEGAIEICLEHIGRPEAVYFLGGYHVVDHEPASQAAFDRLQVQAVLTLLRLAKALNGMPQDGTHRTRLKIITGGTSAVRPDDHVRPFTAGVLGLARAVAREYPALATDIIDVDPLAEARWSDRGLEPTIRLMIDGLDEVREFAIRSGHPYVRRLGPFDLKPAVRPAFERCGVYVLIGGAGNVGRQLSEYLARKLTARLVWIGRRPLDASISAAIHDIECLGGSLSYISADATDASELTQAFDAVSRDHGRIDGVLNLAMVHEVIRLQDLDAAQLRRILESKIDTTYALYTALRERAAGFVALFSSAEAYVGSSGSGAYAAACSFQDAFALYWAQHVRWPVVAINWGYWEGLPPDIADMLASKGIHQLSVLQGAEILDSVLAHRTSQVIALNVESPVLQRMGIVPRGVVPEDSAASAATRDPGPARTVPIESQEIDIEDGELPAHELVVRALVEMVSKVLKIDRSRFDPNLDLVNYGVDSLTVIALNKTLEERVGAMPATLFVTLHTITAVASHLLDQYPAAARRLTGVTRGASVTPTAVQSSVTALASQSHVAFPAVRVVRQVERSAVNDYLADYGQLFRDGSLQQIAANTPLKPLRLQDVWGDELSHLLVDTPTAESVEVFATGDGVPVLLMPAVGLTGPTWRYQLQPPLSRGMRMMVVHPPGYGLTRPIQDCTTRGVAGIFKSVIDAFVPDRPVHLVGSCLSCVSAIYMAGHFPERIASLTLVGAFHNTGEMLSSDPDRLTGDEFGQLLLTALERIRNDFGGITMTRNSDPAFTEKTRDYLLKSLCANSLVAMRYLSEMLTMSPLQWLSEVLVPTQCIYGTHDTIVNPDQSKTIARGIPGATLLSIDGAGHFPYLTHSEEFNTILSAFVAPREANSVAALPTLAV